MARSASRAAGDDHDPRDATALGIEFVYQDLALADNLDITQNMFLGREISASAPSSPTGRWSGRPERRWPVSPSGPSPRFASWSPTSPVQRQTVAIAKAVLWNSKVVFLDEPTAALGVAQTRQVLDLVRRLADQGRVSSSSRTT